MADVVDVAIGMGLAGLGGTLLAVSSSHSMSPHLPLAVVIRFCGLSVLCVSLVFVPLSLALPSLAVCCVPSLPVSLSIVGIMCGDSRQRVFVPSSAGGTVLRRTVVLGLGLIGAALLAWVGLTAPTLSSLASPLLAVPIVAAGLLFLAGGASAVIMKRASVRSGLDTWVARQNAYQRGVKGPDMPSVPVPRPVFGGSPLVMSNVLTSRELWQTKLSAGATLSSLSVAALGCSRCAALVPPNRVAAFMVTGVIVFILSHCVMWTFWARRFPQALPYGDLITLAAGYGVLMLTWPDTWEEGLEMGHLGLMGIAGVSIYFSLVLRERGKEGDATRGRARSNGFPVTKAPNVPAGGLGHGFQTAARQVMPSASLSGCMPPTPMGPVPGEAPFSAPPLSHSHVSSVGPSE
ncbi:hypothetical protein KIPB_010753, partial [Kipferlia bialata]|eukprot:g10753.t1